MRLGGTFASSFSFCSLSHPHGGTAKVGADSLPACRGGRRIFARVYLLYIHPSSGQWVLGGCGLSRLPEFAFGMVLGSWFAKHPDSFENWLLRGRGLLTGLCLYPVALLVYQLPEDTWRLIF